ncbi:septum formation protein Maf [Deferribacter autotrophicus]|uniref:dTTP/UTP pyrophosphatase n=1 Tax=Deferribacter autotrophicus TaxID=500465 RepID=A0A5A8F0J6_9BACT|nr:Maf family protein [Deferribacter autotrophicus]KAA0256882.1 septum formation protein Maf [Deferribacter autotrophicus]
MYQKIILASGSPRRRALLSRLGINFQYVTSTIEEKLNPDKDIVDEVIRLATMKAYDVARIYDEAFIIGADTVVVCEGKVLGKPLTKENAVKMLKFLSGKKHQVITGVAVINKNAKFIKQFHDITDVYFKNLNDDLIEWYIENDEPFDKAGAYGIQGMGCLLVEKIEGSYENVVGLPVSKLFDVFKEIGISPYRGL